MGEAITITTTNLSEKIHHTTKLRDELWDKLQTLPGAGSNINFNHTIPHVLNFHFKQIDSAALMFALQDFALSAGSACNAADNTPSHVLTAMGISKAIAQRSLRLSLSYHMSENDIEKIYQRFYTEVQRLNKLSIPPE